MTAVRPKPAVSSTFELDIVFLGMCLFVRQPSPIKKAKRMHALMPAGGDAEPHKAFVVYDPKYLKPYTGPDATRTTRRKGEPVPCREKEFTGAALELDVEPDKGFDPMIKSHKIPNLGTIVGSRVNPDYFEGEPSDQLAARVTLTRGGVLCYYPGAIWDLDGPREISNSLVWRMTGLSGDRLRWISTDPKKRPDDLFPQPRDPDNPDDLAIVIGILHLTDGDRRMAREMADRRAAGKTSSVPKGPPEDGIAHHYAAHYSLFLDPKKKPLPRFVFGPVPSTQGPGDCVLQTSPAENERGGVPIPGVCYFEHARGVSVYTCMSGGGGP